MSDSISNTKNDILSLAGQDSDFKLIDIKGLESYHANAKNMFLYTDDEGNVNKTNLKIGGLEIKDYKPFNYTFEGSFNVAEAGDDYVKQYITAEYDHKEPVFGYIGAGGEEYGEYEEYEGYLYNFIVTDASCYDPEYDQSEYYIGQSLKVPAYLLDTDYTGPEDALVFVDGKSGNVELPNNEFSGTISEEQHYLNGYFIQSVSMSLKKSSKALLNGYDIVTSNVLLDTKNNIEDNINKNLKNFVKTDNNYQYTIPAEDGPGVLVNMNTSVKNNNNCVNIEYNDERAHEEDNYYFGSQKTNYKVGSNIVSHVEYVANDVTKSSDFTIDEEQITMSFYHGDSDEGGAYDVNICFDKNGILVDNNKVATTDYVDDKIANIDIPDTNSPIVKGDANYSALLDGEYTVSGSKYSNKAISQVSTSLGAASTAGLKGWYYTKVNLSENLIWLSDTRSTGILQIKISTTTSTTPDSTSFVCGWKVGDEVTIVNDKKYDRCAKIEAINGNMIKLDKLPFDSNTIVKSAASIGSYNEPDEFSITAIKITDNDTFKTRSVSSYDKGNIDFGGGANAEGVQTYALNIGAHAEGIQSVAYGQYSHAEGFRTEAGYAAHAEGKNTKAYGHNSHAEGEGTKSLGNRSHAEGEGTTANGLNAHAEGKNTTADSNNSHAEGHQTVANGAASHAEGNYSKTNAIGAHAEGYYTEANGNYSHTSGVYTIATKEAEFACGKYNKSDETTLFSVGNGTDENNRHNVFEVVNNNAEITTYTLPQEITLYVKVYSNGDYVSVAQNTLKYQYQTGTVGVYLVTWRGEYPGGLTNLNFDPMGGYCNVGDYVYVPLNKPFIEIDVVVNLAANGAAAYANDNVRGIYVSDTEFSYETFIWSQQENNQNDDSMDYVEIDIHHITPGISVLVNGNRVLLEGDINTDDFNVDLSNYYTKSEVDNKTVFVSSGSQNGVEMKRTDGYPNEATGKYALAIGAKCNANANNSFAGGNISETNGAASISFGNHTTTNNIGEAAFGIYNKSNNDTLFSVGNGTSDNNRKNVFEIKNNGKIYIDGVNNDLATSINTAVNNTNTFGNNIIAEEAGITLKDDNGYHGIQIHDDGIFISASGAQLIMDDGDFRFTSNLIASGDLFVNENGTSKGDKVATEKFVEQYALSDSDIASISEIDALFDDLNIDYDPMES